MNTRHLWGPAFAALILTGANAMAIEEPQYEVMVTEEEYEIRRYDTYLVAETNVEGTYETAGSNAFTFLADYIFGNNRTAKKNTRV